MPINSADSIERLHREELVPGRLTGSVYEHAIMTGCGPRHAWTYITEGLERLGQAETIITVLREPEEESTLFPQDPLRFLTQMHALAEAGNIVEAGGITEFSSRSLLSRQFTGLLFLPAPCFPGLPIGDRALAAVPVTAEEVLVCRNSGSSRVAAKLTMLGKMYPYSTWCDRRRRSVFSAGDLERMSQEHLASFPIATAFYASVMSEDTELSLLTSAQNARRLADLFDEVPPTAPLVLSTAIDPRANASLVWDTAATSKPTAIGPTNSDASRLSGAYLAVLPGVDRLECGQLSDGYVLMMSEANWDEMKEALRTGKEFSLGCGGAFSKFFIARS